ncbi:hypothetical protein ACOWPH_00770 [Anabaena sp. PCC 7938]|uniref:Uncharacterized protein n=1 Tax=Anabaena cylindrica (strain ATCC 27899 / PCC 7122) TaxID=272123 RepID=K9ZCH0_ANACC|nr:MULTISPECIES: hypothetical protein [Anabaena]AFZ56871.1 hypothetical protein Anacy_1355 [Anabaena cylindrica PCC 7122]MCM2409679.1 hypothetical protein [Anabaena sp. CCAP 1446/1C]BAY06173.1 hypothetical protein NIES19_54560 [Anabaena cylindrica PCC 7122]
MKRQYTTKRNPCPVCGNHHGCAIRPDNLIECLRSFSQHDTPAGYRFIKPLRNDMGGLFVQDDQNAQNQDKLLYSPQKRADSRQTNRNPQVVFNHLLMFHSQRSQFLQLHISIKQLRNLQFLQ